MVRADINSFLVKCFDEKLYQIIVNRFEK